VSSNANNPSGSGSLAQTNPELWKNLEQDMFDSVLLCDLRDAELLEESRARSLAGLPIPQHKEKEVRIYNLNGRIKRVAWLNTKTRKPQQRETKREVEQQENYP